MAMADLCAKVETSQQEMVLYLLVPISDGNLLASKDFIADIP